MKVSIAAFLMVLFLTAASSQCDIPNSSFEYWIDQKDTIGYEMDLHIVDPVFLPEGYFPLEKVIAIILSDFFTPYLFLDTMDIDLFHQYDFDTLTNETGRALKIAGDDLFGVSDLFTTFPCIDKPASIRGMFRYWGDGADRLQITIMLGPERLDYSSAAGFGQAYLSSPDNQMHHFDIPITYRDTIPIEKAILQIRVEDSNQDGIQAPFFTVDELKFTMPIGQEDIELPTFGTVTIFPNPTVNTLQIDSEDIILQATVQDIFGQVVANLDGQIRNIDTSKLPVGHYNLMLTFEDRTELFHFIKH